MSATVWFNTEGSYAQQTDCGGVNGPATYRLFISGTYQIIPSDGTHGLMQLKNLQSIPDKDQYGRPYLKSTTEQENYNMPDSNTLTIWNVVCGSACTITYRRS